MTPPLTRGAAVALLRHLEAAIGHHARPVLDVALADVAPDLHPCAPSALPAVDAGQLADCRWSLDDGPEGLHAHLRADGRLRLHLDRVDPLRDVPGHLAADTAALAGAALGALAGLMLIAAHPLLPLAGVAIGAALGARVDRRPAMTVVVGDQRKDPHL